MRSKQSALYSNGLVDRMADPPIRVRYMAQATWSHDAPNPAYTTKLACAHQIGMCPPKALSYRTGKMFAQKFRSSKTFVVFVVCTAIFTDTLLLNIVLPVLPYALSDRIGLSESDTQRWNSILLAAYGVALIFGSCK